jgi:hypothetical protein
MQQLHRKNPRLRVWGWLFVIAANSFLAYKLFTFNQYSELWVQWKQMPVSQCGWLMLVFLLLPFNWLFESIKWKMMTVHVQKITLKQSIKAVLAGISTGFFTPNRVGELIGRVMYLDTENRKPGVTLSLLNSFTQNIIMTLCGIPACILFFNFTSHKIEPDLIEYLAILTLCLLGFGLFYFFLPQLSQRFKLSRYSGRIKEFTDCLAALSFGELFRIMLISITRYIVFCIQFYFMLRFFGIELSSWQALISIPTSYLFVTFTPSFAFSEAAVRSSFAILVIGVFSHQEVNIALAGICIWVVNFVIPMLVGSVMLVKKR